LHRTAARENRRRPARRRRRLSRSGPMMEGLPHQLVSLEHALLMLPLAALLGGALGVIRPIRRALVPRSSHVIQTQLLMAVVGAAVMIIVADSLARAFAIAGAAGLVRYRAQIDDPKEAGVLLVSLAVGLEAKVGALSTLAGVLLAIGAAWLLGVGRFASGVFRPRHAS